VQLGGLKKFIDAFVGLYSSLSTQQKKIADALFRIAPLSMVGGIPEPAEALIAPAPSYSVPIYTSYALLPTPYPIYRYYPYYPAYPYYPYSRPWFLRPPIGFGGAPCSSTATITSTNSTARVIGVEATRQGPRAAPRRGISPAIGDTADIKVSSGRRAAP
jgi:hypothetical protein